MTSDIIDETEIETTDTTELTLTHEGFPGGEMIEGAEIGWTGSLDELEAHLEAPNA